MLVTTPVQNPISDNTNILWNSPSLGKHYTIVYPWFYKTTPFLSFEEKKQGQTHLFFPGIAHILECVKNAKNQWNCIVLNFNQIQALLFQYKYNCLLHSTTNHFFSFHLCPIGNTLTYSVR